MNGIKVSLDEKGFSLKPTDKDIPRISQRIGRNVRELSPSDIRLFTEKIGSAGHTFCPTTFKNGIRKKENFEQQQFFALDFDNKDQNKKITFEEIKNRSDLYEMPVLFAYDTLSSKEHDKFKVVFLNDAAVSNRKGCRSYAAGYG